MTTNSPVKNVAVLGGGGLMGHGIILACLRDPDVEVTLVSRRQESLDHGLELVPGGSVRRRAGRGTRQAH